MFIYVIGPANGPYKVGITRNVQRRLEGLQTASPVDLALHHTLEVEDSLVARVAERSAHEALQKHRLRGEWFDCPLSDVVKAITKPNVVSVGSAEGADAILDHPNREAKDFVTWMRFHGFTIRDASLALGASKGAVQNWQRRPPPRYILMACYAVTMGIPPVQ